MRTQLEEVLYLLRLRKRPIEHRVKEASYYDETFRADVEWSRHYTACGSYPLWTVVLDRLRASDRRRVLEIGCGSGQLACALRDAGLVDAYCGLDFSERRVEHARKTCPECEFEIADVLQSSRIEEFDYDAVITTDFLEHIPQDLDVIRRIKSGAHMISVVPNFPWVSHVRHFQDAGEVEDRYAAYFDEFSVTPIVKNGEGSIEFLAEGVRKAHSLDA